MRPVEFENSRVAVLERSGEVAIVFRVMCRVDF